LNTFLGSKISNFMDVAFGLEMRKLFPAERSFEQAPAIPEGQKRLQ